MPGPDDTAVLFEIVVLPVVLGLLLAVAVPRRAPYAVTARRPRGRAPPG